MRGRNNKKRKRKKPRRKRRRKKKIRRKKRNKENEVRNINKQTSYQKENYSSRDCRLWKCPIEREEQKSRH